LRILIFYNETETGKQRPLACFRGNHYIALHRFWRSDVNKIVKLFSRDALWPRRNLPITGAIIRCTSQTHWRM